MANPPSRIRYEVISATVADLIDQITAEELVVPEHQRKPLLWTLASRQGFVKSVQDGIPTTGILQRIHDGKTWLEDGLQRLSTLKSYFVDGFVDEEDRKFSELTDTQKNQMRHYVLAVTRYRNATPQQAIRVFDNAQNGMPLSIGQRMHSLRGYPSPLIDYTYRTLLTPDSGLYNRTIPIWGARKMDPKCNTLVNATTLVSGLIFGVMTKKWLEIQHEEILYNDIGSEATITERLEFLLSIYEEVNRRSGPATKSILGKQWNVGNFNAYIAWSIFTYPGERQHLYDGWVNWLVRFRHNQYILDTELKADVGAARSWNDERWRAGYMRVFDPAHAPVPVVMDAGDEDEDDSEE
jgi:hypothetical protein